MLHHFYTHLIIKEIGYISLHFYELCETNRDKLKRITIDKLEKIVSDGNFLLNRETLLFTFNDYSRLYSCISFKDISTESIVDFIQNFRKDLNQMDYNYFNGIVKYFI